MTLSGISGNSTADTVAAYAVADTTWTETGLTYGNMPAIGSALSSTVSVSGATLTPYTWSGLASYINAHRGGLVTIALEMTNSPSSGGADSFNTKEAASNKPMLNVTYTPGPTVATPASANPNPVTTGTTTSVSVLGSDPSGEASLTYTWSANGPASVAFSTNGTNASKASTATFTATGSYTLTATITDGGGQTATSSVNVDVGTVASLPTVADTYVQQGTPTTNSGTGTTMLVKNISGGTTTRYAFLKFDLTSITGQVSSASMTLSGISGNSTADTVAAYAVADTTWTETGLTYGNMPAIGSALSSTVSVSGATLTSYTWSGLAGYINAHRGGLVAIALEMSNTPSSGGADSFNTKEAASNKPMLNVTYTPGPTVATPASANPNPVTTGTTTSVSVLGSDPSGEASLTYTWSANGPASVAFSTNGTNASKASTATFTATGSYTLTATITDGGGQTATSSVNVDVGTVASLPTVADTYVQQGTPTTNYGTGTTMLVKNISGGTTTRYTFLKFDLSSITGPVSARRA